jgi:hypothetical protein
MTNLVITNGAKVLPAKRLSVSEERLCSIQLVNKANPGGRAVSSMGLPEVSASS